MSPTKLFFAALAGLFVCLPAMAQQTKVGTIVSMQAGDTACLVQWRDDSGKRFDDPADFDICINKSLTGKRVTFTYKTAKVLAASCQGDVNCKKSDTVHLIVSARLTPLEAAKPPAPAQGGLSTQSAASPAKPTAPSPSSGANTHCVSGETAMFHCVTGAKAVSVCAAGGAQGYMQYRFGKLGTAPEVVVPEAKAPPARSVSGENVPFSGGGGQWLRFQLGSYAYVVYSGIGRWGRNGETKEIAGVVVEQNGKRTSNVKCVGKETGAMTPATYSQLGIKQGKTDFEFPTED